MNLGYRVRYYIFIHSSSTQNPIIKHVKKKFKKLHKQQDLFLHKYTTNKALISYLEQFHKTHQNETIGFLCEHVKLLQNLTILPQPPSLQQNPTKNTSFEFIPESIDVFCLHADYLDIKYNSPLVEQSIHWNQIICDVSYNFVLNPHFVKTFIINLQKLPKTITNSQELFTCFPKIAFSDKVVGITQYHFTEDIHKFFTPPIVTKSTTPIQHTQMLKIYNTQVYTKWNELSQSINSECNWQQFNLVKTHFQNMTCKDQYTKLPKVSVLLHLSNINQFFVTFHAFINMNYPKDLLQLFILDEFKLGKRLNHLIPQESRIQFIDLQSKNEEPVPLGYQLNIGCKYSTSEIICCMFDTHYYYPNYILDSVCYLLSSKSHCLISQHAQTKNKVLHQMDIASLCFYKNFWQHFSFPELETDLNILLYEYLKYRIKMCMQVPFHPRLFQFANKNIQYLTSPPKISTIFNLVENIPLKSQETIKIYQECINQPLHF